MIHKRIQIQGTVQGVGFRYSARREAQRLGICGYVMNLSDESVYIEAEGPEPNLKEFIFWCHKGPPRAVIRSVSIENGTIAGYRDFGIKY
jgi:acylphosphatase